MNVLKEDKQVTILKMLVEGNSIRSTERITGVHRDTIMRLLLRIGKACRYFMDKEMKDLECQRLELDEIWSFVRKKQNRLTKREKRNKSIGDQYVFYAIDPVSKLIPVWIIGKRDKQTALKFMRKLKNSLNGCRPQISSDAFPPYPDVIDLVFGCEVDYAVITKEYAYEHIGPGRYAPPKVSGCVRSIKMGNPDKNKICTSYVERHNLNMRIFLRRFTRLSLGFSKKLENLEAAVALYFAYYNYCWISRTTRVTPAMEAGITDKLWTMEKLYKSI